jgi:FkbM family methyltransferase
VWREVVGRRAAREYTLKHSGLTAVLRHPLLDIAVLSEFGQGEYAIPPETERRLKTLGRPVRVLDVGANVGLFALRIFAQFPDARVVSFEPDPANLAALNRSVAANPTLAWRIVPAAAGVKDGEATFISDGALGQLSSVAESYGGHTDTGIWLPLAVKPETREITVEVRDVFPYLRNYDLIKMDIEGAEWDLLNDPRFGDLDAIALVLEAHPRPRDEPITVSRRLDEAFGRAGLAWSREWTSGQTAAVVWAAQCCLER